MGKRTGIKDFELYHGVVLTKIVRQGGAESISLIERGGDKEAWAAYHVNASCVVYVKYRGKPNKARNKAKEAKCYSFSFHPVHLDQFKRYEAKYGEENTFMALVCADEEKIIARKALDKHEFPC